MVDKTKIYKDNEQLKELTKSLDDIFNRLTKLESKESNKDDIFNRLTKLESKESNKMDRAKVWATAASSVGSSQCVDKTVPVIWADHILAEYDKRFN